MARGQGRAGGTDRRRGWAACAGDRSCGARPRAAPWRGACACGRPASPRPAPAGCAAGGEPPAPRARLQSYPTSPGAPRPPPCLIPKPMGAPQAAHRSARRLWLGCAASPCHLRTVSMRMRCACVGILPAYTPPPRGGARRSGTGAPSLDDHQPGSRAPPCQRIGPERLACAPACRTVPARSQACHKPGANPPVPELAPHGSSIWPTTPMQHPHCPASPALRTPFSGRPRGDTAVQGAARDTQDPFVIEHACTPHAAMAHAHACVQSETPHLDLAHGLGRREQPPGADQVLAHGVHGALDGRPARRGARGRSAAAAHALPGARAGAPGARGDSRGAAALGSRWRAWRMRQRIHHALLRGSSL